jgi:hypothetical protein
MGQVAATGIFYQSTGSYVHYISRVVGLYTKSYTHVFEPFDRNPRVRFSILDPRSPEAKLFGGTNSFSLDHGDRSTARASLVLSMVLKLGDYVFVEPQASCGAP